MATDRELEVTRPRDGMCQAEGCSQAYLVPHYVLGEGPSSAQWHCMDHLVGTMAVPR